MEYSDLFNAERTVIENARKALEQGRVAEGTSSEEFRLLLEKYTKLFKQTRRLVKFSDRMQNDLNRLNGRLCRSEAKYRNIFENATEGIFRSDPDGRPIEVNPATAAILGYSTPEEVLRREGGPGGLEAQDGYGKLIEVVLKTGECRRFQTDLIRKNGDTVWVEFSAQSFCDESGAVTHIDGLISDVTERKRLHEELTRLANTDGLTGIFNRRFFTEKLRQEIRRALRRKSPLSLIMIDVDRFKSVNDRYGHDAGDKVIRRITAVCREALRDNDVFGRLGGEEFAVVLPDVSEAKAAQIAERLRKSVESETVGADRETIRTTISIGLCRLCDRINCAEALLKAADKALYRAKQNGRNRVCIHRTESVTSGHMAPAPKGEGLNTTQAIGAGSKSG